jgi:hypothetical protein
LQAPAWHVWPVGHAVQLEPQCVESVIVVTHAPSHTLCPLGQAQTLRAHVWPVAHTVPQAPQLAAVRVRSTHALPQRVRFAAHAAEQRLCEQT